MWKSRGCCQLGKSSHMKDFKTVESPNQGVVSLEKEAGRAYAAPEGKLVIEKKALSVVSYLRTKLLSGGQKKREKKNENHTPKAEPYLSERKTGGSTTRVMNCNRE